MGPTGADPDSGFVGTQVDGSQGSHFTAAITPTQYVVATELARGVQSPTFHGSVVEEGTRVMLPGCDGCRSLVGAQVDGTQGSHFTCPVTKVCCAVFAELA